MKKKKEIESKLKEKQNDLISNKYNNYSERRTIDNWIYILKWVLE